MLRQYRTDIGAAVLKGLYEMEDKMKKRVFRIIPTFAVIAALLLTFAVPVFAEEASGNLTDDISYTLDAVGNLTITGSGEIPDYEFLGDNLSPFDSNNEIKTVTVGEGITKLGKCLFQDCSGIEKAVLPEGLKVIGEGAFDECVSLSSINIPEGLTEIGNGVFYHCEALGSIDLPESLKTIGEYAFATSGLKSIVLPDSICEMGRNAFSECMSLKSATLSKNLKLIPERAFTNCMKLKTVVIPEGVEEIGEQSFAYCTNIKEITFPASVKKIDLAFLYGFSLEKIFFEGDAPELNYAFAGCFSTAYYPYGNPTWTEDFLDSGYGGRIEWVALGKHEEAEPVKENEKEATALAAGSYDEVVYCTVCGEEVSRTAVTVPKLKATIKLSAKKKTIKAGKTYTLKVTGLAKGDSIKSFKSSKKAVATVTKKGKIKALKKGTTTITVTLKSGKTAKCKITVK